MMTGFLPNPRALFPIGAGILGLVLGYRTGWANSISFFLGFVLLMIGIGFLMVDFYSDHIRPGEPETTNGDSISQQDNRQIKAVKFGGIGAILVLVLLYSLKIWQIGPDFLWFSHRAIGNIAVASFLLLSLIGHYIIYKPR